MRRQERIRVVKDERTKICQYLSAVKSGGAMDDSMLSKKTSFGVTMNETKVVTATVKFDSSKSAGGKGDTGKGATVSALQSKAEEVSVLCVCVCVCVWVCVGGLSRRWRHSPTTKSNI